MPSWLQIPPDRSFKVPFEVLDHFKARAELIKLDELVGLVRLLDGTWPTDYGVDADILEKPGFCIE